MKIVKESYYNILGLSPQATSVEIADAIEKMRGDVLNCPISQQQLDEIASVLLSEEKRSHYDLSLLQSSVSDDDEATEVKNDKFEITTINSEIETTPIEDKNSSQFDISFLSKNNTPLTDDVEKRCLNCEAKLDTNSPVCSSCGCKNPYFKVRTNWYNLFFIGHIEGTVISVENEPEKNSFCMMRFLFGLIISCAIFYFMYHWLSPIYTSASQTIKYAFIAGGVCILLGCLLSVQWMLVLLRVIFGNVYKPIPVRTARVMDVHDQEHIVRINGEFLLGNIQKQDYVSLWGLSIASTNYPLFGKFTGRNKKGYILLEK